MYDTQQYAMPEAPKEAVMSSQQLAQKESKPLKSGMETITTRFGKVTIDHDHPLNIPKGMLGMNERKRYYITDFPVNKFGRFKLLQSLSDYDLSFIMMPLPIENQIIAKADIEAGAKDLRIDMAHLKLMLVVSVHRDTNKVALSINARAPLFIDTSSRSAEQLVLRNSAYQVRYMLDSKELMQ